MGWFSFFEMPTTISRTELARGSWQAWLSWSHWPGKTCAAGLEVHGQPRAGACRIDEEFLEELADKDAVQEMQDSSKLWPLLIDSLTAAVTSPSEEQNLEPKLDTNSRGYLFIAAVVV